MRHSFFASILIIVYKHSLCERIIFAVHLARWARSRVVLGGKRRFFPSNLAAVWPPSVFFLPRLTWIPFHIHPVGRAHPSALVIELLFSAYFTSTHNTFAHLIAFASLHMEFISRQPIYLLRLCAELQSTAPESAHERRRLFAFINILLESCSVLEMDFIKPTFNFPVARMLTLCQKSSCVPPSLSLSLCVFSSSICSNENSTKCTSTVSHYWNVINLIVCVLWARWMSTNFTVVTVPIVPFDSQRNEDFPLFAAVPAHLTKHFSGSVLIEQTPKWKQ